MKSAPVRKKRCPKGTRRDKSGACVPKEQKDTKPPKPFDFPDPQNLWGPFSGKDALPPKKSPKKSPKTVKKRCPKGTRRDKVSGKCVGKFDKPTPKPKPKKTLKPCKPGQERHPTTNRCRKIQTKKAIPKKKSAKTETLSLEEDMKYQPKKASPKPKKASPKHVKIEWDGGGDIYIDGKHFNIDEEGDLYDGDDDELEGEVLGNYDEDDTQPGMMIGAETGTVTWSSKVSPKPKQ